jgi:hypothetical protein
MLIGPQLLPEELRRSKDETVNTNLNLSMLLNHFYITLISCNEHNIFKTFKKIFDAPQNFKARFLPSMPHDDDLEIFETMKKINSENLKYYKCKNGHTYGVGECHQPTIVTRCPTCKEPIGGNYALVNGNTETGVLQAKIQNGYCLADLESDQTPQSIRNMGFLNTYLLRFFLNSTLYIAAIFNDNDRRQQVESLITNPDAKIANLVVHFYQNILMNIRILSKYLEQSPDEIIVFLHFVINQISTNKSKQFKNNSLKTMKDREEYEKEFCEFVNSVITEARTNSIDKLIQNLNNVIKADGENANMDQLFRIAHDLIEPPQTSPSKARLEFLNEKQIWLFRKQITIETMINNFQNSFINNENRQDFKVLNEFLKNLNQLKLISNLFSIVKMVEMLHSAFNKQIDKQSASKMMVANLLNDSEMSFIDLEFRQVLEQGACSFLNVYKLAHGFLGLRNNQVLMDIDDYRYLPLSYLMPNNSVNNNGIYIYSLIIHLINLQNSFLNFYQRDQPNPIVEKVELETLSPSDLISFTIEKDLLQIAYMYSNYSLEFKQETNLEFNYQKIQEIIENRFLANKPFIDDTVNFNSNFFCLNFSNKLSVIF